MNAGAPIVTEDKPERDPLDGLKAMRAGLIDECSCVQPSRTCVPWDWWGALDRAIAAWTQEREREDMAAMQHDYTVVRGERDMANAKLAAMTAERDRLRADLKEVGSDVAMSLRELGRHAPNQGPHTANYLDRAMRTINRIEALREAARDR